jgi:hypothetical protein
MCGQFGLVLGDPPMVELVGQGPVPHHDAAAGRQFEPQKAEDAPGDTRGVGVEFLVTDCGLTRKQMPLVLL